MTKFRIYVPSNPKMPETGVLHTNMPKPWYGGFIEFEKDGYPIPARYSFYPENYFDSWEKATLRQKELQNGC